MQKTVSWSKFVALAGIAVFSVNVEAGTLYVEITGNDANTCDSPVLACQNIQRAVNVANSGDEIRVAGGTYTYADLLPPSCTSVAEAVVCFFSKNLTIVGGFSSSDWITPQPELNATVIDGEDTYRGIAVRLGSLIFEGFTVTRGLAQGATCCNDGETFGFGGGLFADESDVEIRNCIFSLNRTFGGDTTSGGANVWGGSGAGGAIAIRAVDPGGPLVRTATLSNVTLTDNLAQGGPGQERGGFALGGGLWSNHTTMTATDLVLTNNSVIGGSSAGSGRIGDGSTADGLGGAFAVGGGDYTVQRVVGTNNDSTGGTATTYGGGGFGGALYAETGSLTVFDARLSENQVFGANATNGGIGAGGGVMTQEASIRIERSVVVNNKSLGGDGSGGNQGSAGGGGAYISRLGISPTTTIFANSVFANNEVTAGSGAIIGGGGGALFLQGVNADLDHLTLAENVVGSPGLMGQALVVLNASVIDLAYSIIADHTVPAVASLATLSGSTLNLNTGIYSGNTNDTNEGEAGAGTYTGQATMQTVADLEFRSPGTPNFDYHLLANSPAIDAAIGSAMTEDFELQTRDASPDTGADELGVPTLFEDGFETGDTTGWSSMVGG